MLEPTPVMLVENENDPKRLEAGGEQALPVFSLVAYTGGKAQPKDFPCPVVIDLSGLDIPSQKIPVRYEHKSFQGVGHTETIRLVGTDVMAEGIISRDTSWARDVARSAQNGFPWQASMGGPIHQAEYVPPGKSVTVNGKTFEGEIYVIRKMTLKEISFVDLGADENTSAIVEAQYDERDFLDKERIMTQEQKIETKTPAVIHATARPVDTEKMMQEFHVKMLIDQRRIAAIEKIGGGKFPDMEAKAIEEGWSLEKFQGEYQHKSMPDASVVSNTGSQEHRGGLKQTALEAIALATCGSSMAFLEAQYDEKTLEHVDTFRGVGIQEFSGLACGGRHLPSIKRDLRGWFEAAFSTNALPGILSNIANKVLLEGFLQMDDTWKKITKIASVSNFLRHTRYRMNGEFKFQKVGADGEIKHGQVSEQQFSQQIDTYGILFGVTRQQIINDDLSAFTDLPRSIGIGAADAINDAVWSCLLANTVQSDGKAFFSVEHKNLLTGAKANLDIVGLTEAEIKFSEQERSEGRPLGIPARILLVPASLKVAAETIMKSLTVNETTDPNKPQPVINPHAGKYEVVSSPYLSSKAFKGNSATAWYLFADPSRLAALEVAFLDGKDRPTVERAEADFNQLGVQFRGYLDFGVREQDWRGALKVNG